MSTPSTRSEDMVTKDDSEYISLACRFGCHAPPVGIYHVWPYPLWADQVQALCVQHFLDAEGKYNVTLLVDLTDGEFGRWLHGR